MRNQSFSIKTLRKKTIDGEYRTLCGRDYVVIPVVALVEGVRHAGGSPSPELVMADSFGRHVQTWNGRPIVVNHPTDSNGIAVLASEPSILEDSYLGELLNAKIDDGKLVVEAWLDITAIAESESDSVISMWKRLVNGETIEVSVGAVVYTRSEVGEYNGKKYDGRWDIVIPDHLAFLDGGQVGACSVEDGCGTFRTQAAGIVQLSEGMIMALKGAIKTVSSSDSIGSDTETNESGKTEEKSECGCHTDKDMRTVNNKSLSMMRSMFGGDTLDNDKVSILSKALRNIEKNAYILNYSDNFIVYIKYENDDYCMYKIGYTSNDDDTVTLSSEEPVKIRIQSKVVTAKTNTRKGNVMSVSKRAAAKVNRELEDDLEDAVELEDNDEDELERKTVKKKKLSSNTLIASLAEIETIDELERRLAGTTIGRQLSQSLRIATTAKNKAIDCILNSPMGKNFTREELSTVEFSMLDKMASTYRAATSNNVEEVEEIEDKDPKYDFSFLNYSDADTIADRSDTRSLNSDKHPNIKSKNSHNPNNTNDFSGKPGGRTATSSRIPQAPDIFEFDQSGRLKS